MKVMMNQWKVILRKKGCILTQCVSCKKLKINIFKTSCQFSLFGVSGIIKFIFYMGATSACTPHKSDFVEINMKINPEKLKGISEALKI